MTNLPTRLSAFTRAEPRLTLLSYKNRRALVPYLYVAPAIGLFLLLMLFPMAMVLRCLLLEGAILSPAGATRSGSTGPRERSCVSSTSFPGCLPR